MANTPDQQITLPDGPDPADNPVAFTDFVTDVEPRLVRTYTDEADRTARMLVLLEGHVSHLAAEDRAEIYDGANHISLYPRALYTYARKSADQNLTQNSTALQNVAGLVAALNGAAGAIYGFRCTVWYESTTVADIKFAFTVPAAATMRWGFVSAAATGGGGSGDGTFVSTTVSGTALPAGGGGLGTPLTATMAGEVTLGANVGSLQLQAAQNTAELTQSVVFARSRLEVWRSV